jgi:hypothetical protein
MPLRPGPALCALVLAWPLVAGAGVMDKFKDPEDGRFDLSDWLLDQKGVLPVPLFITEPAVGYGGGVVGLFFRESVRERADKAKETGRIEPPDIYALGGIGTENGTRAGFAGGMVSSDSGRWRWRGGVAKVDANLDFFGLGGQLAPRSYNLSGIASIQHLMMRVGESDTWLVGRWNYFDLDSRFGDGDTGLGPGPIQRASRASGLGVSMETDTRNTIFTASSGYKAGLDMTFYTPAMGSDTRFQVYRGYGFGYWPISKSVVLGGRADGRAANGDVPFYLLPYIEMRGVPLLRLQDRRTALVETEVRWNVDARWALIGFAGAGRAWGTTTSFSDGNGTVTKGVGFRYQLARRLGLYAGIDWAWSTQDHAWYLMVGSAWR